MSSSLTDFTDNLNFLINDYNSLNSLIKFNYLDKNNKISQLRKIYNIFDYILLNYKLIETKEDLKKTVFEKINYFEQKIIKLELCEFNKNQYLEIKKKFEEIKKVL